MLWRREYFFASSRFQTLDHPAYSLVAILTMLLRHLHYTMKHVIRQGNFVIYINGLTLQVANLACSMSGNEDGVKMVRYAAAQIENLCPQVINAARILAARPRSKVAQENMDVFRDAWENQVRILTEAVDDITTIDDFLAVSGMVFCHVLIRCVMAGGSDSELP